MGWFEVSAKDDINVMESMRCLVTHVRNAFQLLISMCVCVCVCVHVCDHDVGDDDDDDDMSASDCL